MQYPIANIYCNGVYYPYYLYYKMNRNIKTFEPDKDVARMLERAIRDGIKITHVLNSAAREWLKSKGYARKKDETEKAS